MAARSLTIFTWGYWGWGNATENLVEVVDAVERARGYRPPIFVDIRISPPGPPSGRRAAPICAPRRASGCVRLRRDSPCALLQP